MRRHYAHIRQRDPSDCGAAALATVAVHYGLPIKLREFWQQADIDGQGTNLLELARVAQDLGFAARAVRGPFEGLPGVPLPAIAHVVCEGGQGHFVVLHRATARSVVVADPAANVQRLSKERFCQTWSGCLLVLQWEPLAMDPNCPLRLTAANQRARS